MLSPLHPLQLVLGLTLWAIWFAVIYSVIGIVCGSPSYHDDVRVRIGLALFTALVGGYLLWCAVRCRSAWRQLRMQDESKDMQTINDRAYPGVFMASLAFGVNLVGGLSTLLMGLPLLWLGACIR